MHKMKRLFGILVFLMTACQPTTPPTPITAVIGDEFTLAPGQKAVISESDLTITLISVPGDERCPLQIECAASGPVTVTIAVQSGAHSSSDFVFLTFTDNDGRVPSMDFQGMTTSVIAGDYVIRVRSILPFPQQFVSEIRDTDYRVSFVVEK